MEKDQTGYGKRLCGAVEEEVLETYRLDEAEKSACQGRGESLLWLIVKKGKEVSTSRVVRIVGPDNRLQEKNKNKRREEKHQKLVKRMISSAEGRTRFESRNQHRGGEVCPRKKRGRVGKALAVRHRGERTSRGGRRRKEAGKKGCKAEARKSRKSREELLGCCGCGL